ncbi:hypothetical protein [Oceanithermus sp.]
MAFVILFNLVMLIANAPAFASGSNAYELLTITAPALEDFELDEVVGSYNKFDYTSNLDEGRNSGGGGVGPIVVFIGRAVASGAAARAGYDMYDRVKGVVYSAAERVGDWVERQRSYTKQIEAGEHY